MLVLRSETKLPLPIESFIVVMMLLEMADTAALSLGLEQLATSQVKISVTMYSSCHFWFCKLRDDKER